jgi:SAM-dependent methyltransferase
MRLDAAGYRFLLPRLGPSLTLWRAAEIACLRRERFSPPVLDLGCGDGIVTSMVLDRVALGVDPDERQLTRAALTGVYTRLEAVSIEALHLPPGSIETVISNSVLEHIEDLDRVLEAVARLLRPGGRFIFTVPSGHFSAWLALPAPRYASWRNRTLQHVNLWSAAQWESRLQVVGLEVTAVHPYLKRRLTGLWDVLDLLEHVWIGNHRAVSLLWQRLPPGVIDHLAAILSRIDLSASRGGGNLIVGVKVQRG